MQYKIKQFNGESLFFKNKERLFYFIDKIKNRKKDYFTENFIIGLNGNFFVSEKTITVENPYTERKNDFSEKKYVNALYIIYDEYKRKVNLTELFYEYDLSRKITKKTFKRKIYDLSTSKSRRSNKSKFCSINNSYNKEYRDNLTAQEQGIKVRNKRAKKIKIYHVFLYEDELDYRENIKCWKQQSKRKKQWKNK